MSSNPNQYPPDNFTVDSLDCMVESLIIKAQGKLAGIIRLCCSAMIAN